MKKLLPFLFSVLLFGSCKKAVEKAAENAVTQAITTGKWTVTTFTKGGTTVTGDFSAYQFQFQTNSSVDAYKNGTLEKSGSWQADPMARTITSNFTNATYPLPLLNGVWNITNTTWTSVEATQTVNGEVQTLRLDKQ